MKSNVNVAGELRYGQLIFSRSRLAIYYQQSFDAIKSKLV